jgi:predicted ArsR family transcriptional regulator
MNGDETRERVLEGMKKIWYGGLVPTTGRISKVTGISRGVIHGHIMRLVAEGKVIRRTDEQGRPVHWPRELYELLQLASFVETYSNLTLLEEMQDLIDTVEDDIGPVHHDAVTKRRHLRVQLERWKLMLKRTKNATFADR